jgi:diguanylate cyclase (GGDEF)-like protein
MLSAKQETALRSRRAFPVPGLARRVADFHWLNLVLALAFVVIPGIAVKDLVQVVVVQLFYAAYILLAHYRAEKFATGALNLALDTWIMIGYITFMMWQTADNSTDLIPLYLIPTAVTSIGHTRRFALGNVLLICVLMLGLRWSSIASMDGGAMIGISGVAIYGLLLGMVSALVGGFKLDSLLAAGQLRRIMDSDELTGLLNLRAFSRLAKQIYHRMRGQGSPFSLMVVDIQGMKAINSNLGIDLGNQVIKTVARVVAGMIRDTDLAARMSGDEFILMLPTADRVRAEEVGQRIRNGVAQTALQLDGSVRRVAVNIGVATYPRDAEALSELIELATRAMRKERELRYPPSIGQ